MKKCPFNKRERPPCDICDSDPQKIEDWEMEFDEKFQRPFSRERIIESLSDPYCYLDHSDIKSFLRQKLADVYQQGKDDAEFELKKLQKMTAYQEGYKKADEDWLKKIEEGLGEERKPTELEIEAPMTLGVQTPTGFKETIKKGQKMKQHILLDEFDHGFNFCLSEIKKRLLK